MADGIKADKSGPNALRPGNCCGNRLKTAVTKAASSAGGRPLFGRRMPSAVIRGPTRQRLDFYSIFTRLDLYVIFEDVPSHHAILREHPG